MFKLKPGNVFQKINKMDKKQAYTWGAIVIVCFIALITLASFMGAADDTSFDGLNTRGYDLAQMPFINDEAEEYLLASKYPDMQGNNSTMLYTSAEKEARQEEDAAKAAEEGGDGAEADASADGGYAGYSGGGYSGGYAGGGAGSAGPTQVGQLGSASMSRSGGSGVNSSWGAPRGDFSPYKSQEKGSELPVQFKNNDARRALSQFAQTSRAAAGFRDSKGANAKRALMGGNVQGSEAFTDGGVDLSKSGGLALDTNAPVSTADLSNLGKDISDAANKAKNDKDADEDDFRETLGDKLLQQLLSGLVNIGIDLIGNGINQGMDALWGSISGNSAANRFDKETTSRIMGSSWDQLSDTDKELYAKTRGVSVDSLNQTFKDNPTLTMRDDWAAYRRGQAGSDPAASAKFSRPTAEYQSSSTQPVTDSELLALGVTEEAVVTVDQDKYARYQKANRAWEDDMDNSFRQTLKSERDGRLINTEYAQGRQEQYNTAYNAKQRDHSNKRYSAGNTAGASSNNGSGNTGSFKSPNDFTTQTQYEDYVNGLTVDNDVKETLLKRKRN